LRPPGTQETAMDFPRLAAMATATPRQRFTQTELLQMAGYDDTRRRGFFEASDIAGRYLYIDRERFRPDESVDELADRFRRGALEICSAAYFLDDRLESAVAHAIFADGAGAVALAADGAGPAILEHRTLFRPEHLDAMGFEYPGGRPRVVLSKDVRRIGAQMM